MQTAASLPGIESDRPGFTTRGWYAISTRHRHEQSVARYLAQRVGVEIYVPLKQVWSQRVDRRKLIETPALPGYIFIRCELNPDVRSQIKKAPGVVSIVSSGGAPSCIPDWEVESLRTVLESRLDVTPCSALQTGDRVRIVSGLLKGAIGIFLRANTGKHRLLVQIEQVGLALSVELHEANVEPLS